RSTASENCAHAAHEGHVRAVAHMLHLWADSMADLWPAASLHADHPGQCRNSAAHAAYSVHQACAKEASGIEGPWPEIGSLSHLGWGERATKLRQRRAHENFPQLSTGRQPGNRPARNGTNRRTRHEERRSQYG